MTGIARLYTQPEVAVMADLMPTCELDFRLKCALVTTEQWVANPQTRCCVCDKPLNSNAAYWVVLLPSDPEMGLGASGGVCGGCGDLPRITLEAHANRVAVLMFENAAGNA